MNITLFSWAIGYLRELFMATGQIGLFIIFFVLGIPVLFSILLAVLSKPRDIRVSGLLLLGLVIIGVIFIASFIIIGLIMSAIIP